MHVEQRDERDRRGQIKVNVITKANLHRSGFLLSPIPFEAD
jgi:hypothetical protein